MNTNWRNTPGSKQHWLYRGTAYSGFRGRILGMVYEVNPTAFTVYKEKIPASWEAANREFLAEMPTLDEAKDLLMTVVGSQT
jgi:hypothetical protein